MPSIAKSQAQVAHIARLSLMRLSRILLILIRHPGRKLLTGDNETPQFGFCSGTPADRLSRRDGSTLRRCWMDHARINRTTCKGPCRPARFCPCRPRTELEYLDPPLSWDSATRIASAFDTYFRGLGTALISVGP